MASEETQGRQPIPPGKRRRLQQWFEQGSKMTAAGQFDYATEMYAQCIEGDPGNPIYVKSFLNNLQKKYNQNKKGSKLAKLKGAKPKAAIKKSRLQKDWKSVIKTGLELLKLNPWDTSTLIDIGHACGELELDESQLDYLNAARDTDPEDPELNRVYGRALERQGVFEEALRCFSKVVKAKPGDEEAQRALADLAVKRTIKKGGYEEAQTSQDVAAVKARGAEQDAGARLSPEDSLKRAIEKDPDDLAKYIELSELYFKDERFENAEQILTRAMEVSGGGDMEIRERLEDAQIRRVRHQLQIAENKARAERTDEAVELYNRWKNELNSKEMEVYRSRCQRNPTNLGFKYELALRLQKAKNHHEAIKLLQQCRSDLKRKAFVLEALADCFFAIKQYPLALSHFEQAIPEYSGRDEDRKKNTMYKTARLAEGLKDWDTAQRYLTELAGVDFGYKDVSQRLDKISRIRENRDDPDAE